MNFSEWLENEMRVRDWTRTETARRGSISISMLDKVISGHAEPGRRFLDGIAKAFKKPHEEVYRAAGILPSATKTETKTEEEKLIDQINAMMEGLSEESKKDIYEYARMRRRIDEEKAKYKNAPNQKPRHADT